MHNNMGDPGLILPEVNLPPQSVEAEQNLLGALFFDQTAFARVVDILEADDFYRGPHRYIYQACLQLFTLNEPIDLITVGEMLNDKEALDAAGGRPYLMELALSVATAENVTWYANKIKQLSIRRKLQHFAYSLVDKAQNDSDTNVLEYAQTEILKITQEVDRKQEIKTSELKAKVLADIQDRITNPENIDGIKTGFFALDSLLGSLKAGKFIILGARPSMGKTACILNISVHVAIEQAKPVFFYSLEMPPEELMERALVSIGESPNDLKKLEYAAKKIPDHFLLLDKPGLTVTQLRASVIKTQLELGEPGLIVVDYLQLMSGKGSTRTEELSRISREMKQIAREFRVPLIALAQLSREVEKRQDKRPMMSDLRDSGSLEADADTILLLYRDEYYNKDSTSPNTAEVIIAKNRGGSVGKIELYFRPNLVKFLNAHPSAGYGQGGIDANF